MTDFKVLNAFRVRQKVPMPTDKEEFYKLVAEFVSKEPTIAGTGTAKDPKGKYKRLFT